MAKLTKGKKMLLKLEGHLSNKEFSDKLSDGYSYGRYRNGFVNCIRMLRKEGYNDVFIEDLLRSKAVRWAGDCSNNRYGLCSANDLKKWMDANPEFIKECETWKGVY